MSSQTKNCTRRHFLGVVVMCVLLRLVLQPYSICDACHTCRQKLWSETVHIVGGKLTYLVKQLHPYLLACAKPTHAHKDRLVALVG